METKKKSFNFDDDMKYFLKNIKCHALNDYELDLNNTEILKFALCLMNYSFAMADSFPNSTEDLPKITKLNLDYVLFHYFDY